MKGLFWRVFAWYLVTTFVILGLSLLITMITDPDFRFQRAVSVSLDAMEDQGQTAVRVWRQGGQSALQNSFAKAARHRYLFDAQGRELTGGFFPSRISDLVKRTMTSKAIELEILPPDTFGAVHITTKSGESFVFVRALTNEGRFRFIPRPLPGWARIALGLFTATLMCVLFAIYVTSPLTRLRTATRAFAAGDLKVRIGTVKPFNRGDEFTDLARDFDNMATQLENLVLTQQRLLGDISHELRSPLTRLQLALEIARRRTGPEAEQPLARIEQEADKLNVLIGQILRAAKVEQLRPGDKRLFDLSNLVREVTEDADFEASGSNRRVRIENNEISLICGNRELLRSAIENVVRNAIRYTPEESEVTIDLSRPDAARAKVVVRDQGPGVPADALPHLFEPFYRVNDARDRDSGGAGLGLSITRHVVAAHGGAVQAANRDGGGFEIEIDLPLTLPESSNRNGIKFRSA